MNHKETQEKYQKLLDKLADIMTPIAHHADHQATFRCPYKNKDDRCTAKFGCRNQRKLEGSSLLHCASDDKLDYRNFWEMPDGEQIGEKYRSF